MVGNSRRPLGNYNCFIYCLPACRSDVPGTDDENERRRFKRVKQGTAGQGTEHLRRRRAVGGGNRRGNATIFRAIVIIRSTKSIFCDHPAVLEDSRIEVRSVVRTKPKAAGMRSLDGRVGRVIYVIKRGTKIRAVGLRPGGVAGVVMALVAASCCFGTNCAFHPAFLPPGDW
jgi:hypothetical protein